MPGGLHASQARSGSRHPESQPVKRGSHHHLNQRPTMNPNQSQRRLELSIWHFLIVTKFSFWLVSLGRYLPTLACFGLDFVNIVVTFYSLVGIKLLYNCIIFTRIFEYRKHLFVGSTGLTAAWAWAHDVMGRINLWYFPPERYLISRGNNLMARDFLSCCSSLRVSKLGICLLSGKYCCCS